MGTAFLPPGFRFHPTDEELIGYYLHRKVHGLEIELEIIPVIDLYKFDPWELPDKSFIPNRDMEWFFFCPRDRKYPNTARANRATKAGYWKATGKDRKIVCQSSVAGYRKTLVFYRGRAPLGDRTDWIMHEYRLSDELNSQGSSNSQGAFVLCRVVKKNEQGHKTYDSLGESTSRNLVGSSSIGDFSASITSNNSSRYSTPSASPYPVQPVQEFDPPPSEIRPSSLIVSPDLILDSSKDYAQAHEPSKYLPQNECLNTWQPQEHREFSTSTITYSNFSGEIESVDDLSQFNYMSSYLGYENYMGFCDPNGMPYQGH